MAELSFADRLAATGLPLSETDLPKLQALVSDMDRAAALLRDPRPYANEPLNAFHLPVP
jgi:hypothetical protein